MNIMLILEGIIVGIAKIIPGLSGAILMISFNIYDRTIDAITNFFSDIKNNLLFIINFGIGVGIGIVCFSNVIYYLINNYYVYTTSLFVGLIMGGIPVIGKNIDNSRNGYIILIVSFVLMIFLSISSINNNYVIKNNSMDTIIFVFAGIVEAFGTVIPGISSTALLMIIGIYNKYIYILSNMYNISSVINNIYFIIPFGIGLLGGLISISLLVDYLFKNYKEYTFSFIMGICLASIVLLIIKILFNITSIYMVFISLLLILIGYIIGIII